MQGIRDWICAGAVLLVGAIAALPAQGPYAINSARFMLVFSSQRLQNSPSSARPYTLVGCEFDIAVYRIMRRFDSKVKR